MSRVQLALRVADLEGSVAFYAKLFGAEPAKRRPGYANFAIDEPPLKLVLLEGQPGEATVMDHLGVEVFTTEEVGAATQRLASAGLVTLTEDNTECCTPCRTKRYGAWQRAVEAYAVGPTRTACPSRPTTCCGSTRRPRASPRPRRRLLLISSWRLASPTSANARRTMPGVVIEQLNPLQQNVGADEAFTNQRCPRQEGGVPTIVGSRPRRPERGYFTEPARRPARSTAGTRRTPPRARWSTGTRLGR